MSVHRVITVILQGFVLAGLLLQRFSSEWPWTGVVWWVAIVTAALLLLFFVAADG